MRSPKQPAKLAMLLLLALLLLCNGVGNVHCARIHENSVDLHALLDFKQGINNPQEALSSWNITTHFCHWHGVNCTTAPPFRVSSLKLTDLDLAGQISSSLGNLTFLETLDLSYNNFVGPLPILGHLRRLHTLYLNNNHLNGIIPDSLTNSSNLANLDLSVNSLVGVIPPKLDFLSHLLYLNLSANYLAGQIPTKVGSLSNLTYLDLSSNMLVGQIPPKLDSLINLVYLGLSKNMLVGQIPPSLGVLPNLAYIYLRLNQLEGSIPDELGQLLHLKELLLGNNKLSGKLPHAILNPSGSLQILGLEFNMLSNALPPNIGDRLPSLIQLNLAGNLFEGNIPASLGNAQGLKLIDLSNNSFTGTIPTSFGKLSNLTTLNLENNQLETRDNRDWEFVNALRNCRSLKRLSLSLNQLQGSIPQSIGDLSPSLEQLVLLGNNLSGQVPQSIRKLSALTKLSLGENNLSGTIEGWVGDLKGLVVLYLQSNSFTGLIPSSIGNLTKLAYLHIGENEFEGHIPTSLGNLKLLELGLGYNNLQGYIPPNFGNLQDLTLLNLSHNNLQGGIPQIGNLNHLTSLDLSSNKLTGQIPVSLGQCYGLKTLQMGQNFLTGNIPLTFGNLSSLSMLNLSHNNLSGTIPSALNTLKLLNSLDLSYNHLQGEIPTNGVFENARAVSLEGNWGLCGGPKDLHIASCATVSKKAQRRDRLIKVLIPIFGFLSLILLIYFCLLEKRMRRRTDDISASLGENFLKVSYADLAQATTNFSESNLVGRGGYGSVYRGKLKESKVEVAVKVFDLDMHGAEKSFLKECEALRSIQHRNLLPIITACSTVDNAGNVFKALVYEFMPNGNLDTWLHHREDGKAQKHLSLAQRLSIAVNMADALDYLHNDCGRPTIHCDLKPSNILLDDDMNALLGDFGIASLYKDSSSTSTGPMSSSSIGVKGTIGYIAPEYAGGGRRASTSGDVYGFGIILMEMMTGKRPTDPMFKDGVTIVHFVESNFPHEIAHVIDANLSEECKDIAKTENYVNECLVSVLQLALSCTHPAPSERMNMKEIASKMHAIKTSYVGRKARVCASLEFQ
ncbi:hypothetical protein ACQJBY_054742 [Aegilops geniculata]